LVVTISFNFSDVDEREKKEKGEEEGTKTKLLDKQLPTTDPQNQNEKRYCYEIIIKITKFNGFIRSRYRNLLELIYVI
jgi:hypothetical protein